MNLAPVSVGDCCWIGCDERATTTRPEWCAAYIGEARQAIVLADVPLCRTHYQAAESAHYEKGVK